jgi:arylsulfatase A-like enzyme
MKQHAPYKLRDGIAVILVSQAMILAGAACGSGEPEALPDDRLSVVLVSVDTLRADHLSCYGYDRPTSPTIDRFATEGLLFEQCVNTGGGTLPVHLSMLTSLSPTVHGVFPDNGRALSEGHTTLAEALREDGYATAAFVDGGYLSGNFGFTQGFDLYFDRNYKGVIGKIESYFDDGGLAELLPRALAWLRHHRDRPFFLFLHTYDTHSAVTQLPYESPPPFLDRFVASDYSRSFDGCRSGRCASELLLWHNQARRERALGPDELFTTEEMEYMVALYDGAIAYVDHEFGRLLMALEEYGVAQRTLVVLTSDHGEEFLEHGLLLHRQNYEEVARVPLILRFPDRRHAGRRVADLVSTLDLLPSILDATGLSPLLQAMGASFLPLASNSSAAHFDRPVFIVGGQEKLRTRGWSLLADGNQPIELYSLTDDPTEQVNRIADRPDLAAELFDRLHEIRSREIAIRDRLGVAETEKEALAPDELEDLRALGYLEAKPAPPPD